MTIQINKDRLKSHQTKFDKLWLKILVSMIDKTNNNLYVLSSDSKFYNASFDQYNPVILRIPKTLTILSQIPHTGYSQKTSQQKKLQNVLIDFRFQLLFQGDKQKYKKFYSAYMFGDGIFAPFQNHYIHITQDKLKKASKPIDEDLLLPKNWLKFARIVEDD